MQNFIGIGFVLLTVVCFSILMVMVRRGIQKTNWTAQVKRKVFLTIICTLALWTLFVSAWSASGKMADFTTFPFNFLPVLLIPILLTVVIMFSSKTSEVLARVDVHRLIALQTFRFFVELLLWLLFLKDVVPVQMTFEGRNFDILVGITAPVLSWMIYQKKVSRMGLIAWNAAGLLLLLNIVVIAIVSTPSPLRLFHHEPANTIVTTFPVSWLPGLLVPLAYVLHLLSLKQILSSRQGPDTTSIV